MFIIWAQVEVRVLLELVKAFEQANDLEVPYEIVDRRPGNIASCYADASKAQQELGWTAKRGLISMCRDAVLVVVQKNRCHYPNESTSVLVVLY